MKEIKKDEAVARKERLLAEQKKLERDARKKAIDEFKSTAAYGYLMKDLAEEEELVTKEMIRIQFEDMKTVFLLPIKEQRAKLALMSKRHHILTGLLGAIKKIKRKYS